MLFLSEDLIETKQRLVQDIEDGKIDAELAWRQALKLDANDHIALVLLGTLRAERGDAAEAEELLWRALQVQPCSWRAYFELGRMLKDQDPLSKGLHELGCRKLLLDPESLDELEDNPSVFAALKEHAPDLDIADGLEMMADALRAQRDFEPLAVTARLRQLRLIHQLQDTEFPEPELVDAVVEEGESIVPLLVGLMRGWVQDIVPEEDIFVAVNSMAMLGEIGEVAPIPYLLELVTLAELDVSGPCGWALNRIVEQQPAKSAQVFWEVAPGLDGGARIAVAERVLRYPEMVIPAGLFERLFDNFDNVDRDDRGFCFEILLSTAIMVLGRPGLEFARVMLRRHGSLLSRKSRRTCEDMIEEFSSIAIPARPPAEPSPHTVYDICNGDVDWEEEERAMEEDEDSHPPEPVRRKFTPGRNDPCWCGSGKKYKKCHLDSDEASARGVAAPAKTDVPEVVSEFDTLRGRIVEFLTRETSKREGRAATAEFFGSEDFDEESGPIFLMDWMIHDRIWKTGRTVMEEFVAQDPSSITARERQFLESSARSYMDLFEVREVKHGSGLEVKSLTSDDEFFVHDVMMAKSLAAGEGLFSRVVTGGRGLEFGGTGLRVPPECLAAVLEAMEQDKRDTGLSWPVYLKRDWPRVYALTSHIIEK
jgi:hypothetical protein